WIAPPSPNQQFQVTVTVIDPDGARDARSKNIFLSTLSATIDAPQDNEAVRGTIPVRGRVTGFQGRVRVQFFVDPDTVNPTPLLTLFANQDGSFSLNWDTTLVDNGRHAIAIWAIDETTGNSGATMTNVIVDNQPPEPSIYFISPRDNTVVTLSDQVLVVEIFATDTLSGLARVDFFRDFDQPLQCRNLNNSFQDTNPDDGWKCEWPVPTDTSLAGLHTLRVVAYDSSGN
ncbi:MAG: Ig-like domain-containing protein, partial [bacterium]